jgi:hypothetical protein
MRVRGCVVWSRAVMLDRVFWQCILARVGPALVLLVATGCTLPDVSVRKPRADSQRQACASDAALCDDKADACDRTSDEACGADASSGTAGKAAANGTSRNNAGSGSKPPGGGTGGRAGSKATPSDDESEGSAGSEATPPDVETEGGAGSNSEPPISEETGGSGGTEPAEMTPAGGSGGTEEPPPPVEVDACVASLETCNGGDDDCDGDSDEREATRADCLGRFPNASEAECRSGTCVQTACREGYVPCGDSSEPSCERSCGTPPDPGGSGGSGGSGGGGGAGTGGTVAPTPTRCASWRSQGSDDSFGDLGENPGEETNSMTMVRQYVCRAVPNGRSQLALGKGVPTYGCYGTYESNGARVGFGKPDVFEVLLPNTSDCSVTWQAVSDDVQPLDLGTDAYPGLYACRGRLDNEPYPGGTVSGRELGQWIAVGDGHECWTQFHGAQGMLDGGSKRILDQLEVLVRATR